MTDAPFWADDFDLDFAKVFPDARKMIGDLAALELVTVGTRDAGGRLNHPAVWNGDQAMLAYFGFRSPARPLHLVAPSSAEIRCTAWEAIRDAWPHHYLMHVEGYPVWDTFALTPQFEAILWDVRGHGRTRIDPRLARRRVMQTFGEAVRQLGRIVSMYPAVRAQVARASAGANA